MRYAFSLILLLLALPVPGISAIASAAPVSQQTNRDEGEAWVLPLNLSQSGAASAPRVVVDSSGDLHVLWREDAVPSFYYTRKDGSRWRRPVPLELPFGTRRYIIDPEGPNPEEEILLPADEVEPDTPLTLFDPVLLADNDGRIHAFWLGDGHGLYHSSVLADEFGNFYSWSKRQRLSDSALGFSAAIDSGRRIHLSYVDNTDSAELPAGIYHRYADDDGAIWTEPASLYESAYFRAAGPDDVNIQLVTGMSPGDRSGVYVVMENRLLEEALYVGSADRGASWREPSIVDRRREEDSPLSKGPSDIDIVSTGDVLHLSWLAGHDTLCQQYHQWSESDGRSWQPAYALETDNAVCPEEFQLINGGDDLLFLLNYAGGAAYLQAWNGKEWSEQESQPVLIGFDDPVTHRQVSLDCQQQVVDENGNLVVVGCGLSEENEDVWLLVRPLGDEDYWFSSEPTIWSEPVSLMTIEEQLLEPVILSDSEDRLHAFWLAENTNDALDIDARIYYSSWTEGDWSRQVPLIQLDMTKVDQLSGVYDHANGPFLLWRDEETNTFYSSTVLSERILFPAEWAAPFPLFEDGAVIGHPVPTLDADGGLNVIYAVPLNEGRGIYLMYTADYGITWSEPLNVIDAAAANWAMVDRPSLAQSTNGDLHVLFTVYSLEPDPAAKGLYYTRSEDVGETWSDAELITEGDISWSQVVGVDEQTVLVAWQQKDGDKTELWSQQSMDSGMNWDRPLLLLEPTELPAVFSLSTHVADQPYVVQVQTGVDGDLLLQERSWRDNLWSAIEFHNLDTRLYRERLLDLAAAVTEEGLLMTIFNSEPTMQNEEPIEDGFTVVRQLGNQQVGGPQLPGGVPESSLIFTHRTVEPLEHTVSGGSDTVTIQESSPVSAPTAAPVLDSAPTVQVENTNDAEIELGDLADGGESGSIINQLALGIVPVVLIILIVFAAGIIKLRPKR